MAEKWMIEDFDTSELLESVDDLDSIRGILADGPRLEPPQLRNDLMKLHGLAMQACRETGEGDRELFDLATDVEGDVEDIRDAAERIPDLLRHGRIDGTAVLVKFVRWQEV